MARRKQIHPMQRIPSGEVMRTPLDEPELLKRPSNGHVTTPGKWEIQKQAASTPGSETLQGGPALLAFCVLGIYGSFLTWAYLQERIMKTPYATVPDSLHLKSATEYFRYPIFMNTIQSLFAFVSGSIYLYTTLPTFTVFPSNAIIRPLLLVSITSTLASPFGYASLAHVDYLTFVLAKSCKLLPVMALKVTIYRHRYSLSKYLIVLIVTTGVVIFTLYQPNTSKSRSKNAPQSSVYGLSLLSINLLFDGLTNTTQDQILKSPAKYGVIKGPQMMVAQNLISTALMVAYLVLTPQIPSSWLPEMANDSMHELSGAMAFLQRHPKVLYDVLGFAACGAFGQLFIYLTLERFSSLLLVMVTVTRKMLTMALSVVLFGKSLVLGQWTGVGLVCAGVLAEAGLGHREKRGMAVKAWEKKDK